MMCIVTEPEAVQVMYFSMDSSSYTAELTASLRVVQVQQRAATLLLSVEASPMPDSSCIQATARALAKLLSALGGLSCQAPSHGT